MQCAEMLEAIRRMRFPGHDKQHPVHLMEICGTHTMAIAKAGLRQLLPPTVKMISGPGCPVCVTPAEGLDRLIGLSHLPGVRLACYGDLLRVPGSVRRSSLRAARALGADVQVVYSPMDALETARKNPNDQIVFAAVGFETTAPGTAVCLTEAKRLGVENFSVLSLMKYTEPVLRTLLSQKGRLDGLLCPGHVAAITGADAFSFLPAEYHLPAVVGGFESEDVIRAVYDLCRMISEDAPACKNDYERVVRAEGNPAARAAMNEVFEPRDDLWRGIGPVPMSGMKIRSAYRMYDAEVRFSLPEIVPEPEKNGCRCGDILRGDAQPEDCPLFGKICTPADPVGPCMVSGEGACAAAFKYHGGLEWMDL